MRTAAVAFVSAALTASVLTPMVRGVARRLGLLDHALSSRKVHGRPIPRLGGIAIVLAFYAPLVALLFVDTGVGHQFVAVPRKAYGLFGGGAAIALLGVWDDVTGCSARTKFLVQFGVGAAMYALGFRIDLVVNPFGPTLHLGYLGLPFTMLWIAGVINAMNLIDGLDGLAGGVALIAVATTFTIAVFHGEALMILFTGALGGAVIGFLFYNFNPATIFMGDSGSMFLGFVLATTAIQTNLKSSTAVTILVPIIALGVPIADTLLAMGRRAMRGVPMFSADRGHIHHRLVAAGLSDRSAVLVLYSASAVLGAVALVLNFANSRQATLVLIALSIVAFVALRRLGFLSFASVHRVMQDRSRNVAVRREIRRIGETLRFAAHTEDIWVAVKDAAQTLGAAAVLLAVPAHPPDVREALLDASPPSNGGLFRARFGLDAERPTEWYLELGWSERQAMDRDTEIAIELLCDHLAAALDRVRRPASAKASEAQVKQAG